MSLHDRPTSAFQTGDQQNMQKGTDGMPFWAQISAEMLDPKNRAMASTGKGIEQAIASTAPRGDGGVSKPVEWANAMVGDSNGWTIPATTAALKELTQPEQFSTQKQEAFANLFDNPGGKKLTGDIAFQPEQVNV